MEERTKNDAATAAASASVAIDDNDYDDGADSFASHPILKGKKHADLMIIFCIFSLLSHVISAPLFLIKTDSVQQQTSTEKRT